MNYRRFPVRRETSVLKTKRRTWILILRLVAWCFDRAPETPPQNQVAQKLWPQKISAVPIQVFTPSQDRHLTQKQSLIWIGSAEPTVEDVTQPLGLVKALLSGAWPTGAATLTTCCLCRVREAVLNGAFAVITAEGQKLCGNREGDPWLTLFNSSLLMRNDSISLL